MIKPLRQLLAAPHTVWADSQIIAFAGVETCDQVLFCRRIAAWEESFAGIEELLIALYLEDSLEFAAALFALWRLGKQALVPANNLPASCQQLAQLTPCFAGDFPGVGVVRAASGAAPLSAVAIPDAGTVALVLFTSGSTSDPVPIPKNFAQLETELVALESQWGDRLAGAKIASTVSHHHIYGLLFRLLWPLCCGRPFARQMRDYWEELALDARVQQPLAIISSPAHLRLIPPLAWASAVAPVAVFSSGAPLAQDAALAAKAQLAQSVSEVYGSTETGGIGWREQDKDARWLCLPGVGVQLDENTGQLQVRSGHLPNADWFTGADRATLDADGRFSLCGRADRVAKVGGKRISLTAIEQLLLQQPDVAAVRVLTLPERGERLGAVVVLTNDGNKHLVDQGKTLMNEQLKRALAGQVDRIAIPRYWRYLGDLPQNRQGKTTQADLQALFSTDPLPRLPELVAQVRDGKALLLDLFVPANLYYFDGHFPGRPVLPGVVQTHWAVHYGREFFDVSGGFAGLEVVKFQQIITANQHLQLRLEYQPDKGKLYFGYTSRRGEAEVAHASGRIVFSGEPSHD